MKLIITLICCLTGLTCVAHAPSTVLSEPLEEISEKSQTRLHQANNGNTLLMEFTDHSGINVQVYDKSRKVVASTVLKSELWKPKEMGWSSICGIFNSG